MVPSARTSLRVDRLRPLNVPRRVEVSFDESRKVGKSESLTVGQSDSGDRRTDGQTDRRTVGTRRWGSRVAPAAIGRPENATNSEARTLCPTFQLSDFPTPVAVEYNGTLRSIEAVLEIWRVDDEWWREQIARRYIEVVLAGGKHVVLFEDLLKGTWFVQEP